MVISIVYLFTRGYILPRCEVFLACMNCIFVRHFNSTADQHSDDHPDSRSFIIITLIIIVILALEYTTECMIYLYISILSGRGLLHAHGFSLHGLLLAKKIYLRRAPFRCLAWSPPAPAWCSNRAASPRGAWWRDQRSCAAAIGSNSLQRNTAKMMRTIGWPLAIKHGNGESLWLESLGV